MTDATGQSLLSPGEAPTVGPPIAPVADAADRPLWSVMIPSYHCADLLAETLQSVLDQDPGPGRMQIEVVDDCSTKDDPEAVVRRVAGDRVQFHRQERNVGAIRNFNTCAARSRGRYVHVLHGDDRAEPGFYREIESLAERFPQAAMLAVRAHVIDSQGKRIGVSARLRPLESSTRDPSPCFYENPLRTPAVVLRRSFYEEQGGFLEELPHSADWEMWVRAIALGGGAMSPRILASYREFDGNDTSRLMRTGVALRDRLRLAQRWAERFPAFDIQRFRTIVRVTAAFHAARFHCRGDAEAAAANRAIRAELLGVKLPLSWRLREALLSIPVVRRGVVAAALYAQRVSRR